MNILIAAVTSTAFTGLLTCDQANGLIDKIKPSNENHTELVQMVQMSAEKECFSEDAHD